jgi:hypothetical protein
MRKSGGHPKRGHYAELTGIVVMHPRGDYYLVSGFGSCSGMEYLRGVRRSADVNTVFGGAGSSGRGAS